MTVAYVAVLGIYLSTAVLVCMGRTTRRILGLGDPHRAPGRMRMLVVGTFYNEGWFRAHILPLSVTASLETIWVVTDRPLLNVDKVRYLCPPDWALRFPGRVVCRAVLVLWAALRFRPDVLMGYHIMPNALLCLIGASLFGGRSIYQMTGGPIQIMGGGAGSENALLARLKDSSAILESLLFHIVRQFGLVVVRGSGAHKCVLKQQLGRPFVVTGGVDTERFRPNGAAKKYDLVYVSRLVPSKGLEYFLEVVAALRATRARILAAIVGSGPLKDALQARAVSLGITDHVEFLGKQSDVVRILACSRLLVLTSPSEGMSIAVLEGMATGLGVAVTDVGETRDAVENGRTGILLDGGHAAADAAAIGELLEDDARLQTMARAARDLVIKRHSVQAIASSWDSEFTRLIQPTVDRLHIPYRAPA